MLEIYNPLGTVTVIVPEGVEVLVRGRGPFASQKVRLPARPPIAGGASLTIDTCGPAAPCMSAPARRPERRSSEQSNRPRGRSSD
jgi:hypothetical protein